MVKQGTAFWTLGQFAEAQVAIIRALPKALEGADPKNLLPLLQNSGEKIEAGLGAMFASLQTPAQSSRVRQKTFALRLNYDEPVEAKVRSGFVYANPAITDANFRKVVRTGAVEDEAILVNFDGFVESPDAVAHLDTMGLRPGVPKELADLSKMYPNSPELAACLPAVALGDSWQDPRGYRRVACLGGALLRELDLDLWSGGWLGYWRLLAFRK